MNTLENYGKAFADDFEYRYHNRILQILYAHGNESFAFRGIRYNIGKGDYSTITEVPLTSDYLNSQDFDGSIM